MENTTELISYQDAWDETYGSDLTSLANKILNFERIQKLKLDSVLDLECGNGEALKVFKESNKACFGTNSSEILLNSCTQNLKNTTILKTQSVQELENLQKVDLVTCLNESINDIQNLYELQEFFDNVYKHLNNGGIFIFNYYTNSYYESNLGTIYNEREKFNYLQKIERKENKFILTENFYLKLDIPNKFNRYNRISETKLKNCFANKEITNAITNSKFRYLITTNANLSPVRDLDDVDIAYIIAIKRED